jgi:hypothetical protein
MDALKKIFFAGMLLLLSSQFLKSKCTFIGIPYSESESFGKYHR